MRDLSSWRFPVAAGDPSSLESRRQTARRIAESGLSRRRFLGVSAGATGLVLAGGGWASALASSCEPSPLSSTFDPDNGGPLPPLHLLLPGLVHSQDSDPSSISDFNGHVGYAIVDGTGIRWDRATGALTQHPFEVDLRFMKGEFVSADGRRCHGAFALI